MPYHGYTIDDMAAIADARGCSYGVVQSHLEFGAPWPRLHKSVKWPKDSAHHGEMQLDSQGREISIQADIPRTQQPKPPKEKSRAKLTFTCTRCGDSFSTADRVHATLQQGASKKHTCRVIGDWCPACNAAMLPENRPTKEDTFPKRDDNGNKLEARTTSRCFRCRTFYTRALGGTIYTETIETQHRRLAGYLCPDCLPVWLEEATKKPDAP